MDAVVKFLPSPLDKPAVFCSENKLNKRNPTKREKLLAYAFKVINDPAKGALVYLRIYSGVMHNKQQLMNTTKN